MITPPDAENFSPNSTSTRSGRAAEAIPLHERTLTDRERILGHDHPDTQRSRDNLAAARASQG
jgi:hypothetical protein